VFSHGALVGLEQTIYYKEKFDEALIARKYDAIRYYCLELDRVQEVMGSGGFNPEFDLNEIELQDLADLSIVADIILFSSFESDGKGYICFMWHEDIGKTCAAFIESFLSVSDNEKANAALQVLLSHSENLFLRPEWWEEKNKSEKDDIILRVMQGSPFVERLPLFDRNMKLTACTVLSISSFL